MGIPHHPDDGPQSIEETQECPTCEIVARWGQWQPPRAKDALGTCPNCGIHIYGFRYPPGHDKRSPDEGAVEKEISG